MKPELRARVAEVRAFNRFYTRLIGLLDDGHLATPFSLAQVRVLYELRHQDAPVASALCDQLALDPGYLSRMLRDLERRGLVRARRATDDGRRRTLALTPRGARMVAALERKADDSIAAVLGPVAADRRDALTRAMREIRATFEPAAAPAGAGATAAVAAATTAAEPFTVREHEPGDLGWIVSSQGAFYARAYGWGTKFEALVAQIAADFLSRFDPERERCWIAEHGGARVGSVMLVARSRTVAQLRVLYVDPAARGLGIGARLVAECTRFARSRGYRKIVLWTNGLLTSARRLYEAEGYTLRREEPYEVFGPGQVAQVWELPLTATAASRSATARPARRRTAARA